VVNPDRGYTHGGILAAIIDTVADYAIAAQLGRPVPTIDVRVDYHKAAMPGDLVAKARVVRMGSQYSTAEAYLYDKDGALVASGRGTYLQKVLRPPGVQCRGAPMQTHRPRGGLRCLPGA
jgi:uncharacterized protein (TIGR00369 family)